MNGPQPEKRLPRSAIALAIGAVAGLCGSIAVLVSREHCDACGQAAELLGGRELAIPAISFYAVLAVASAVLLARRDWRGGALFNGVGAAFLMAAGAHLVLIALLLRAGIICYACFATALGGFIGAGAAVASRRFRPLGAVSLIAFAAVFAFAGVRLANTGRAGLPLRLAQQAYRQVLSEPRPPANEVKAVVFVRDGCRQCEFFRERVLSPLRRSFGERLVIEERPAGKGMPTPTTIVIGNTHRLFVGYQELDVVKGAVEAVSGQQAGSGR